MYIFCSESEVEQAPELATLNYVKILTDKEYDKLFGKDDPLHKLKRKLQADKKYKENE